MRQTVPVQAVVVECFGDACTDAPCPEMTRHARRLDGRLRASATAVTVGKITQKKHQSGYGTPKRIRSNTDGRRNVGVDCRLSIVDRVVFFEGGAGTDPNLVFG